LAPQVKKIPLRGLHSCYTSGSAYAEFEEGKKGELKAGEYADFIVLSNDLTQSPAHPPTSTPKSSAP